MRTFEQRKEEILRRSEEKIKKRKRIRTAMIGTIVPLCICLGMLFMPREQLNKKPDTTMRDTVTKPTMAIDSKWNLSVIVEEEFTKYDTSTQPIDAQAFVELLASLQPDMTFQPSYLQADDAATGSSAGGITIILKQNGTMTHYLLEDRWLTEEESGILYPLTEEQANRLYAILGLFPDEEGE